SLHADGRCKSAPFAVSDTSNPSWRARTNYGTAKATFPEVGRLSRVLWRRNRGDLEQPFRFHLSVEPPRRIIGLVPFQHLRQPRIGDGVAQTLAGFSIAHDDDGKQSSGRLLRRDDERSLTRAGVGRQHHAVGDAGTWRLLAGVIRHGKPAGVSLDAFPG